MDDALRRGAMDKPDNPILNSYPFSCYCAIPDCEWYTDTMTSAPQDTGNSQRRRAGPAASCIPDLGDMALQVRQVGSQEAIDLTTCADTIGPDKYQAPERREKLEDSTPGDNRDQILDSMQKQIAELKRSCEVRNRKIAGMKAKISEVAVSVFHLLIIYLLTNPLSSRWKS